MNIRVEQALTAEPAISWMVINRIYETGQHPEQWPGLLNLLGDIEQLQPDLQVGELLPHIQRALCLNQQLADHPDHAPEVVFDNVAVPLAIVNQQHQLVFHANLPDNPNLFVENIAELLRARGESPVLISHRIYGELASISLGQGLVAVLLLGKRAGSGSTHRLQERYGLTETEVSLLADLLRDESYAQIAEQRGVTENTVRSQIKQVFDKTGIRRRTELVSLLLGTGLEGTTSAAEQFYQHGDVSHPKLNQTISLAAGSLLGYAEYGDPQGTPMLLLHNVSGSRLQIPVPEACIVEQGVRLIVPDRPQVGLSSWRQPFSMQNWADAVGQLLDHLGLSQLAVIGNSMGGIYAMALAVFIPQRVSHLALVSSMAPLDLALDLGDLEPDMQQVVRLGARWPRLAAVLLKLLIKAEPESYVDRRIGKLPAVDQQLYAEAGFHAMAVAALQENMRHGVGAMARDFVLLSQAWGFEPQQIRTPVSIWHGDSDITAPFCATERLARAVPHSRFFAIPGETHMLLHRHWHSIVALLLEQTLPD